MAGSSSSRAAHQEITALLVSGQIQSAWICGYPYVQFEADLDLVATPVWHGQPLCQSYLIASAGRKADDWTGLEGDVHAFSDPRAGGSQTIQEDCRHRSCPWRQ
ncbi:PhnD/SsuA/transferrin family substrate-binding protein, partial [Mesorhizobium sp.]|uniref:PhnD/SsuA/transferrin family substrate-binding protein n=1 Tax=Mesorhizobium sp. TaxID=1871066 RepID=UPI00338FA524